MLTESGAQSEQMFVGVVSEGRDKQSLWAFLFEDLLVRADIH